LGSEIGHPDASEKGKYIRVSFADNGMGFDKKDAEQLFQVFCGTGNNGHSGIKVGWLFARRSLNFTMVLLLRTARQA
jgi:NAD(P)H-hydrate repair Nnr-like enzyme with NAD(P)H-hydrate epimerase domain